MWEDVFFFEAEDGIRDYKVTGVQTCALPISLEDILPHDLLYERKRGFGAPVREWFREGLGNWFDEIGRASCRERVGIGIVDVAGTKEEEEHNGDGAQRRNQTVRKRRRTDIHV